MKKEVMVEGNGEVVLEKKKKKEISMELLRWSGEAPARSW